MPTVTELNRLSLNELRQIHLKILRRDSLSLDELDSLMTLIEIVQDEKVFLLKSGKLIE